MSDGFRLWTPASSAGIRTQVREDLFIEIDLELQRTDDNATEPPTREDYLADVGRRLRTLTDPDPVQRLDTP